MHSSLSYPGHSPLPTTHQVGLLEPTHGTALIGGYDIRRDMGAIYSLMGVCPQHDLLWETLTGREHLLFYGRLKGLTGEGAPLAGAARLLCARSKCGGVAHTCRCAPIERTQ